MQQSKAGWGATPVNLGGSADCGPTRMCGRCDLPKPEGGGVLVRPKVWHCSECWRNENNLRKAAQRARG